MPIAVTTSAGATVTVYRPGGVVSGPTSEGSIFLGTPTGSFSSVDIPLYAGHGLVLNDRIIVGIDSTTYKVIINVDGNTVSVFGPINVTTGDTLVNLGADTGASSPNYDGSDVVIYSTPDTSIQIDESRVTTNENGEYAYYHNGDTLLWELVRGTDGVPVAFVVGAYESTSVISGTATASDYSLSSVLNPLIEWFRTGDDTPLFSFSPFAPSDPHAQLLRVGDRAQTSGDSRTLGYFSADIPDAGAVESQAIYGINRYTGSATAAQIGVHGIGQSLPGAGNTQTSVVGLQGFGMHLDPSTGVTTNLTGVSGTAYVSGDGTVTNAIGLRGAVLHLDTDVDINQALGVYGLVTAEATGVNVAAGGRFDTPTTATNNYGVIVKGDIASIGFTSDLSAFKYIRWHNGNNRFEVVGSWLQQGNFTTTSPITSQVAGNSLVLGANTDADIAIAFDTLTTEGHITYKGASTNVFEFDRGITSGGNITSGGHLQGLKATQSFTGNDTIAHAGRHLVDLTITSGACQLTLAAPSSVDGKILILRCVALNGGGTLTMLTTNCKLAAGATWVPNADDTITLIASGSIWYELCRSANA